MTAYTPTGATPITHTLVGSTADSVTINGWQYWVVINQDSTNTISCRADGVVAVVDADGTWPVLPGSQVTIPTTWDKNGIVVPLSLVSAGTPKYSVGGSM